MHRSGTSCLAGALQQAGLYLGDVSEYNPYNKKGNREHNEIMRLNESILNHNDSSWDSPPQKTLKWNQEHIATAEKLINTFEKNTTTGYWGFKDPRTLLTLSFWETLLTKPKFIGTFRHPLQVAHSIFKREGFAHDESRALSLWNTYNNILISKVDKYSIPLISFDLPPTEYQKKLKKTARLLELPTPERIDFYDKTLISNNHKDCCDAKLNGIAHVFHIYKKMIYKQL